MEKTCGSSDDGTAAIGGHGGQQILGSSLPADIRSRSNTVNFIFKTDYLFTFSGWSVSWSAVTPGKFLEKLSRSLLLNLMLSASQTFLIAVTCLMHAFILDCISFSLIYFCQSAALPLLAAHAQTWKPTVANTKLLALKIAAADIAQVQVG